MTEWEIWACAAKVRADYGDMGGSLHAAVRAADLEAAGDLEGYVVWLRIMACLAQLAKVERDDETLH